MAFSITENTAMQEVMNILRLVVNQATNAPPAGFSLTGSVTYYGGPEDLKYQFTVLGYDYVIQLRPGNARGTRLIQNVPEHYPTLFRATVTSIDETDAPEIQDQIKSLMRYFFEYNAIESDYMLNIENETPNVRRVGGLDKVWETVYSIRHKDE